MIISNVKELHEIKLDNLPKCQLYMHPIELGHNLNLPSGCEDYIDTINNMLCALNDQAGKAFVTIDTRIVSKGKTHRRGGKHVDGNYIFDWGGSGGGGGWLTGENGRVLSPENHKMQYCDNKNGGCLIISSAIGCKAWRGKFKGYPGQGGNCSHIKTKRGLYLKPEKVYFMNSTAVHESLPMSKTQKRVLIRITLPPKKINLTPLPNLREKPNE